MLRKNVVLMTAAAVLGAAAVPAGARAQTESQHAQGAVAQGPQRIELVVHGLSCPFCAYGLERKLKKIEGLDSLNIDFHTGGVLMLVQDGSKATDQRIRQLVQDAGFEVGSIERAPREEPGTNREDDPA